LKFTYPTCKIGFSDFTMHIFISLLSTHDPTMWWFAKQNPKGIGEFVKLTQIKVEKKMIGWAKPADGPGRACSQRFSTAHASLLPPNDAPASYPRLPSRRQLLPASSSRKTRNSRPTRPVFACCMVPIDQRNQREITWHWHINSSIDRTDRRLHASIACRRRGGR
jgi:hypothetical protein